MYLSQDQDVLMPFWGSWSISSLIIVILRCVLCGMYVVMLTPRGLTFLRVLTLNPLQSYSLPPVVRCSQW